MAILKRTAGVGDVRGHAALSDFTSTRPIDTSTPTLAQIAGR